MTDKLWEGVREGCGTCEFGGKRREWTDFRGNVNVNVTCRRHPPVVMVTRLATETGGMHDLDQAQPSMDQSDWCGEYKRKGAA